MARRSEKKRTLVLDMEPLAYRREVPEGSIEVYMLGNVSYGEKIAIVGRLMLSDKAGEISKFGLFGTLEGKEIIVLEKIEGNGVSILSYLIRTAENTQIVNSILDYGDIVMLEGVKLQTADGDVFLGEKISLLSKAISDVYDSNINFDKRSNLYTHRHLQLIQDQGKVAHFRSCSVIFRAVRQFLYGEDYEEVSMTLLQKNFEAGLANPFVTHVAEHDKDMYLRLTSELLLRKLMIAGFSKIFEISKSFRNQGATISTLPQFTILELYRAYATRAEMETLVRKMICAALVQLYGSAVIPTSDGEIDCSGEWPAFDFLEEIERCTGLIYDESCSMPELLNLLNKAQIPHPVTVSKRTIASALYSHVVSRMKGPAFLRNLPAAQSPLFKLNDNVSTVDETLLVINGMLVADLVNAERDPRVIRRRMEEQLAYRKEGQSDGINEDIISAMKYGLPPCRGIGMGMERLLMLLLNTKDIRDVELFPVF